MVVKVYEEIHPAMLAVLKFSRDGKSLRVRVHRNQVRLTGLEIYRIKDGKRYGTDHRYPRPHILPPKSSHLQSNAQPKDSNQNCQDLNNAAYN